MNESRERQAQIPAIVNVTKAATNRVSGRLLRSGCFRSDRGVCAGGILPRRKTAPYCRGSVSSFDSLIMSFLDLRSRRTHALIACSPWRFGGIASTLPDRELRTSCQPRVNSQMGNSEIRGFVYDVEILYDIDTAHKHRGTLYQAAGLADSEPAGGVDPQFPFNQTCP